MTRSSTAFASLFALALAAGAAQAQAPRDGSAAALDGNVVGGGIATLSGGSDDATVTYSTGGAGAEGRDEGLPPGGAGLLRWCGVVVVHECRRAGKTRRL